MDVNTQDIEGAIVELANATAFIVINSQEEYTAAERFYVRSRQIEKMIKDKFADPKQKAKAAHAAICALEKSCLEKNTAALKEVSEAMSAYALKKEHEANVAREKLEAEQRAKDEAYKKAHPDKPLPAPVLQKPASMPAPVLQTSVHMIDKWRFEITEASKLPSEYMVSIPNEAKIKAEVEAKKEATDIPGVRVWKEKIPCRNR